MKVDLTGRTAIVSGCTQGIGKAIAEKFAQNGAGLVLLARNQEKLETLAHQLKAEYSTVSKIIVADFDVQQELERNVKEFMASYSGAIDILVNNVRGPVPADLLEMTPLQLQGAFQRHLICNHTLSTIVIPRMRSNEYGRIVNVIGTIYHTPYPGLGLSIVRASEVSWAKALSLEVAQFGITVNNILPGPTETDELEEILQTLSARKGQSYEAFRQSVIDSTLVKRFANPEEIANAAMFLASREASFITGSNLTIDGGFTSSI